MIEFHRVAMSDKDWMKKKFSCEFNRSCEYSFGNVFGYDAKMKIYVAEAHGCLIVRCAISDDYSAYCCPVGDGDFEEAVREMVAFSEENDKSSSVFGITRDKADAFNRIFGGKYTAEPDRDSYDYVYLSTDLIELKGKKYQSKRNHISYFTRTFNWEYEKICRDNIDECIAMSERWLRESNSQDIEGLEGEFKIIKRVFENYEALEYVGGLLRVDGAVIAYTMGEPLSKVTFCVHFEKAFSDIRGAYPMINQQFVKNELNSYTYINREDDVGAENLRKAKLSYHPAFLLEKYSARIK